MPLLIECSKCGVTSGGAGEGRLLLDISTYNMDINVYIGVCLNNIVKHIQVHTNSHCEVE